MWCPPGITSSREDCCPWATLSSDNPLSGKLFLVDSPQGCHMCIVFNVVFLMLSVHSPFPSTQHFLGFRFLYHLQILPGSLLSPSKSASLLTQWKFALFYCLFFSVTACPADSGPSGQIRSCSIDSHPAGLRL